MANIFRGPLYVNRRELPPIVVTAVCISSLAVVAVVSLPSPLGAAQALPLQVITKPPYLNADTSRGIPKTLTADKQLPFFVAPPFAPPPPSPLGWLNASTAAGTPKTLTADKQLPFFSPVHFIPPPQRPNEWLNASTASGTPKTLTADKQLPFFVASHFGQIQHPAREWLNPDTTQDMSALLRVLAPPFVPAPYFGPLRFWWQPPDTSAGTPKVLTADKQLPFFVLPQTAPDRIRPVTDTSQSVPASLLPLPATPLPPGQAPWNPLVRFWWQPPDTSISTPDVLIDAAPVVVVVTAPPLQGGARPPWGGTKRRYIRIGNKEFVVNTEADVRYLLQRELSKPQPIVEAKPKGKPSKVTAPAIFEQKPLNPVSVEIALRSRDEEMIAVLKRLIAEHDERDVEFILLTLH